MLGAALVCFMAVTFGLLPILLIAWFFIKRRKKPLLARDTGVEPGNSFRQNQLVGTFRYFNVLKKCDASKRRFLLNLIFHYFIGILKKK